MDNRVYGLTDLGAKQCYLVQRVIPINSLRIGDNAAANEVGNKGRKPE